MGRGTLNPNEAVCVDISQETDRWMFSPCLHFHVKRDLSEPDSRCVVKNTAI